MFFFQGGADDAGAFVESKASVRIGKGNYLLLVPKAVRMHVARKLTIRSSQTGECDVRVRLPGVRIRHE